MQPRPYQTEAINGIEKGFDEFDKLLAVMPTGSGKTLVFAWLAQRRLPGRTLILAHRDELIDQALDKIYQATGIVADKEKAESHARLDAQIVVASVQTMMRRIDKWPHDHFSMVVADEAHHVLSDSWQLVLDRFDTQVLGVTATPDRGDKRNLGTFFESVAVEVPLIKLIKEGFLSPIELKSVPLKIDLSRVHLLAGDFSDGELGHALEPYLTSIAKAIKEHACGRKTLAFLPLIDTSKKFVSACEQEGIRAKHVDGLSADRAETVEAFQGDRYELVSNAMLLTEGFDNPSIDCIAMLRPTKSRPLFCQAIGRGTRVHPGKKNLLVLDFLWLHEKHRIVHPADLISQDEEEADLITQLAAQSDQGAIQGLDLMELAQEASRERERRLREKLEALSNRRLKYIDAREFCLQHNCPDAAFYEPAMRWEYKDVTDPQKKYLVEANIDLETVSGRGHASVLLDIIFKEKDLQPASPKQRWVMAKHGWPNAFKATRADAKKFFMQFNSTKQPT